MAAPLSTSAATTAKSRLVAIRLYRSLLRAVAPFTGSPSAKDNNEARVLNCLLERTGYEDPKWFDRPSSSAFWNQPHRGGKAWEGGGGDDDGESESDSESDSDEDNDDNNKSESDSDNDDEDSSSSDEDDDDDVDDDLNDDGRNFVDEDELDDDFHNRRDDPAHTLFRKLLREAISGSQLGIQQMQFPHQVELHTSRLRQIIQREFASKSQPRRDQHDKKKKGEKKDRQSTVSSVAVSTSFSDEVRRQVAFLALRRLNEKLSWYEDLRQQQKEHQTKIPATAYHVSALPQQPTSYLQQGTFLIAHPNMKGYFRRSVICLLDHKQREREKASSLASFEDYTTYGLVVNRTTLHHNLGQQTPITLAEAFSNPLPDDFVEAFGHCPVRNGGPVANRVQMMCALPPPSFSVVAGDNKSQKHFNPEDKELRERLQGSVLRMAGNGDADDDHHHSSFTEQQQPLEILYPGDLRAAAEAVLSDRLSADRLAFFVGACTWGTGQLESEVERGVWLPCRAPPEVAFWGTTTAQNNNNRHSPQPTQQQQQDDLWVSMLSACGDDLTKLAHLTWKDDGKNPFGGACDIFEEEESM